jgi:hypothetical protein
MAIPEPFNSVKNLLAFTSFQEGAGNGRESVLEGTFLFSQFATALRQSRNEIYRKTGRRKNDEFSDDRLEELTEAELWLATARLYPKFGERIALKFPESNLAGVGSVSQGADTPSPLEKAQHWIDYATSRIRGMGLQLLESPSTRFTVSVGKDASTKPYSCLGRDITYNNWSNCLCN